MSIASPSGRRDLGLGPALEGRAFGWFLRALSHEHIPVTRRPMMGGRSKQSFKLGVPMEPLIVAKNEFIQMGFNNALQGGQGAIFASADGIAQAPESTLLEARSKFSAAGVGGAIDRRAGIY
jgi:hypothetical protein